MWFWLASIKNVRKQKSSFEILAVHCILDILNISCSVPPVSCIISRYQSCCGWCPSTVLSCSPHMCCYLLYAVLGETANLLVNGPYGCATLEELDYLCKLQVVTRTLAKRKTGKKIVMIYKERARATPFNAIPCSEGCLVVAFIVRLS